MNWLRRKRCAVGNYVRHRPSRNARLPRVQHVPGPTESKTTIKNARATYTLMIIRSYIVYVLRTAYCVLKISSFVAAV